VKVMSVGAVTALTFIVDTYSFYIVFRPICFYMIETMCLMAREIKIKYTFVSS